MATITRWATTGMYSKPGRSSPRAPMATSHEPEARLSASTEEVSSRTFMVTLQAAKVR